MRMVYTVSFLILACTSTSANAWFFFFIPPLGSFATSDNTCLPETAKEGDTLNSASGNIAKVTKLSGTSSRCKDASNPILATVDYASGVSFTSKAGIELPEKFKSMTLTDRQRYFEGILLKAKTDDGKLFVQVSATKRSIISSMPEYVSKFQQRLKNLDEPTFSGIEQLSINNFPAWQFEEKGKLKNLFGTRMTMLHTVIESKDEVVIVQGWGYDYQYIEEKEEFKKLPFTIKGLTLPALAATSDNVVSQPISSKSSSVEAPTTSPGTALPPVDTPKSKLQEKVAREPSEPKVSPSSSNQPSVDYLAEARKSALILGCANAEVKVTGAESSDILVAAKCAAGQDLLLKCDQSGLCLRR